MSDSYCSSPLSVRCAEVIVVDCERGAGDLRELLRQVYWKDGTLLAEHDWLHDDPTYANFFLRSAAERGEWLPVKLLDQAGTQPDAVPVPAAADQSEVVFSGVDVHRDRNHDASRLPNYLNAGWRNVTPVCEQTSCIGLGFDTAAGPVRLAISLEHAADLAHCLAAYIKTFAGIETAAAGQGV